MTTTTAPTTTEPKEDQAASRARRPYEPPKAVRGRSVQSATLASGGGLAGGSGGH
jgi:hypothetical protein